MKQYHKLDEKTEKNTDIVGHKGVLMSYGAQSMTIPFSIVLTNSFFDRFIRDNALGKKIPGLFDSKEDFGSQTKLFSDIVNEFKNSDFSPDLRKELKEVFELMTIHTSEFQLDKEKISSLLLIQRSMSYPDTDSITDTLTFIAEDFESFLQVVKKIFLSAFTPSSQQVRAKKDIGVFSVPIIISSIREFQGSVETTVKSSKQNIIAESYTGFYDLKRKISKDFFVIGKEFLKVKDTSIKSQHQVAVFSKANNEIEYQHYLNTSSSQSVPEQIILESARLAKKIHPDNDITVIFSITSNTLECLSVKTFDSTPKHEQVSSEQTISDSEKKSSTMKKTLTPDDIRNSFVESLKHFLEHQQHTRYGPSIKVILRSLEHKPSPQAISQGLLMAKQIFESE
ncbi:MAG: hypothetical protein ACQESC_02355 [Nanobdellota archaeon]